MANNQQICYTNVHTAWNCNGLLAFFCCQITEEHYFKYASNILRKRSRSQDSSDEWDAGRYRNYYREAFIAPEVFSGTTKMMNNGCLLKEDKQKLNNHKIPFL